MIRTAIAVFVLALVPGLIAQSKAPAEVVSNPVVTTVRQMEQRYAKNLIGAADEMPADKYGYRPTAEQITFGHLMMHTTEANNSLCAAIAGEQARSLSSARLIPRRC